MKPRYTVFITPAADRDLEAAVDYYNQASEGLGYRFAEMVEEYINRIADMPTASMVRYKNVRCKLMHTFPYLIMYTADEAALSIAILRFFLTSREPFW